VTRRFAAAAAVTALSLAACTGDDAPRGAAPVGTTSESSKTTRDKPPRVTSYEPIADEEFPNGKRLAARIAQRALTYRRGATAREIAADLRPPGAAVPRLARALKPAVDPDSWSAAEVVYPQLSGVTDSSLGAMVVMRQTMGRSDGRRRTVTRVVDVRLRRASGPWSLDTIASVGGRPVPRPGTLSAAAERVLDNPNIVLPDSARWDIHRGNVDPALLRALARAAASRKLSLAVIRSGHPHAVWATSRPSAHSAGAAADIYAIAGRPVIAQREVGSEAHALAEELIAGGAYQLGSPWVLGAGGPQSFTDAVHQDHIHVQQSPLG
jgi:hypothetical protein